METQIVKLSRLTTNKGQIQGVPPNPRFIRDLRFKKLVKSIQENPEMLELREIIAVRHGEELVILCGNMRFRALKEIGAAEAPVKVIDEGSPEFLRAVTILDNSHFGQWDMDELANTWDELELAAACIDVPTILPEDEEETTQDEKNDKDFCRLEFELTDEEATEVKQAISKLRKLRGKEVKEQGINKNINGNALFLICREWEEPKR